MPRLPSQDPKAAAATPSSGHGAHPHGAPVAGEDQPVPRPIGPERLRALREAILNGTYPTDSAVTGGLTKLFRQPAPAPSHPMPPAQDA